VPVVNGPGLHSAFWLWPDTRTGSDADWPRTGEIDIAELYSGYPNLVVPFLHYADDALGPVQGLNTTTKATSQRGVWHTYTLTWSADRLDIAVDGTTILSNTAGAATFRKAFILNLSQLLGSGLNAWDGKVALPSSMEVDYVKVWK
jgi:beta-glucanase (GH16 family)